jgi:hypothetical protein
MRSALKPLSGRAERETADTAKPQTHLVPLLTSWFQYALFTAYVVATVYFTISYWVWWAGTDKPIVFKASLTVGFIANFYASWISVLAMPLLLYRASLLNPHLRVPKLRVAMVVTKAPCEPLEMVQQTLKGLLNQVSSCNKAAVSHML